MTRLMDNNAGLKFFLPFGIFLIVFGIIQLNFKADNFLQTTGKITQVDEIVIADARGGNDTAYDVSFTYTVNGKDYEGIFGNMSGTFKEGDSITVYYDPDDPGKVTNSKIGGILAPIFIVVGALAAGFGAFITIKRK